MATFRVIIKGTPAQAREAAGKRGLILRNARANARNPQETNAETDAGLPTIATWFAETTRAPFTAGDLLWYRSRNQ